MSLIPAPSVHPRTLRSLWEHYERGNDVALAALLCREARRGVPALYGVFSDHPLGDDWRDFAFNAVARYLERRRGTVYVVANPVHANLYKVGQTRGDVRQRLKSLNSAGVVGFFLEVAHQVVADRFFVETQAQKRLTTTCERHKEFFRCTYQLAQQAIETAAQQDARALSQLGAG